MNFYLVGLASQGLLWWGVTQGLWGTNSVAAVTIVAIMMFSGGLNLLGLSAALFAMDKEQLNEVLLKAEWPPWYKELWSMALRFSSVAVGAAVMLQGGAWSVLAAMWLVSLGLAQVVQIRAKRLRKHS